MEKTSPWLPFKNCWHPEQQEEEIHKAGRAMQPSHIIMSGRKGKIKKPVTQQESQESTGERERLKHVNLPVYFVPIETVWSWWERGGQKENRQPLVLHSHFWQSKGVISLPLFYKVASKQRVESWNYGQSLGGKAAISYLTLKFCMHTKLFAFISYYF